MLIIVLLKRSTFSFTLVFKNARCQSNTFVLWAQCLHLYSARPPAVRWGINNSQIKFRINYLMWQFGWGHDLTRVTDSCRDGWNVRNCSSSQVQIFRDRWNAQIGDAWNVRNWLNINFLKLVEIWIWILQNLRCLSCKSTNFVLWRNPRWCCCFGCLGCACLVCCLVCIIYKIGLYTSSLRYKREYP